MVARKIPAAKQKPVSSEPSGSYKNAFIGYEKPKEAFTTKPMKVFYRTKKEGSVEQRRYYLGFVQIAYVRIEGSNLQAFLINGDGRVALKGVVFQKEATLNDYLSSELSGHQK